jgi:FkbM family methyltransferase
MGHRLYQYFVLNHISVRAFCVDKRFNHMGKEKDDTTGLRMISPETLAKEFNKATVVIGAGHIDETGISALYGLGFEGRVVTLEEIGYIDFEMSFAGEKESIMSHIEQYEKVWDMFSDETSKQVLVDRMRHMLLRAPMPHSPADRQYFEPGVIQLTDNEVFVDVGFYIGDTTAAFIRETKGKYRHIFGFEPDNDNLSLYHPDGRGDITVVAKGLWKCDDVLRFDNALGVGSAVNENGPAEIAVTSVDVYFKDSGFIPSYIKMDTEGSEKEVLLGAEHIIKTYRPRLAVSVYHRLGDIYELPLLVHSLNPGYRFYLRHYSSTYSETVLYAT